MDGVVPAGLRRRSPTGCRGRAVRPSRCCSAPCGSCARSDGSAAGRRRRTPSRRRPAGASRRCGRCRSSTIRRGASWRPPSGGRTRTRRRRRRGRARRAGASSSEVVTRLATGAVASARTTRGSLATFSRADGVRARLPSASRGLGEHLAAGACEKLGAHPEHELRVVARTHLDRGVVQPARPVIRPRPHPEPVAADRLEAQLGAPAVGARRDRVHRMPRLAVPRDRSAAARRRARRGPRGRPSPRRAPPRRRRPWPASGSPAAGARGGGSGCGRAPRIPRSCRRGRGALPRFDRIASGRPGDRRWGTCFVPRAGVTVRGLYPEIGPLGRTLQAA